MSTSTDAPEHAQRQATTPALLEVTTAARSSAFGVDSGGHTWPRATRGRPSGRPAQLQERAGSWTWRTDPEDQQLPHSEPGGDSASAKGELVRAFAWFRLLIG